MSSDEQICVLCDQSLLQEDERTVQERAIESLIAASIQRKDKKHLMLEKCSSIKIHKNCHTAYTRKRNIDKAIQEKKESNAKKRRKGSDARSFDFSTQCFFCGESAEEFVNNRKCLIRYVQSDDLRIKILEEIKKKSSEEGIEKFEILQSRLMNVENLCAVNAQYHPGCSSTFHHSRSFNSRGRPTSENTSKLVSHIANHIFEHLEECQFSLQDILSSFDGEVPKIKRIKSLLEDYFGDEISMYALKHDYIICFRDAGNNLPTDSWFASRVPDQEKERRRIVEMAANIIYQDIRSKFYDIENYKAPSNFLDDVTADIPPTLQTFLNILINNRTRYSYKVNDLTEKKWTNRIATIAHILISSVRPRQFLSPIMLGLSSMIHKKHGSRELIDSLSFLGLCSTYNETQLFESSIINDPEHYRLIGKPFLQFVYDNADHNTNTIDGNDTFHAMGGVMCVTPASSIHSNGVIKRLTKIPSADELGNFGFVELKQFQKGSSLGLKQIPIKNVNLVNQISQEFEMNSSDIVWLFGKKIQPTTTVGWNGFMESYCRTNDYDVSRIIPMPFVNASASHYDTIYTVLIEARRKADYYGQKTCFVTFDQPLYLKAREILSCVDLTNDIHNLSNVVVRLGGFHTLMSFLGSVGNFMEGSGLKEAFCTIIAENSADKALTGHAFSRAVRGHILTQAALGSIILSSLDLSNAEVETLNHALNKFNDNDFKNAIDDDEVMKINKKFTRQLKLLKERGPTSQLWIQYFELITIVKEFIKAERSGNWQLHLQCVQKMIPYFHASGHFLYAKSSHLYLQDMLDLNEQIDMESVEYKNFTELGYFTMRRTNKFWSGVWSDMTTEQVLMRSMKSSGGLTHVRGITQNVLSKWILSTIVLTDVCTEVEDFCNKKYVYSEQHVDVGVSRISRDAKDLAKLCDFFIKFDPFPQTDKIMSIYSGVIGGTEINCFNALDVGLKLQSNIIDKDFGSIKLSRKSKVVSLRSVNSSIKINDEMVTINPLLLFQRISLNVEKKEDMRNYLKYELTPFPMSLFDEGGMRKTQKSAFYDNFKSVNELPVCKKEIYVIDGGFLLHRVVWHLNDDVKKILSLYVSYVKKHFTVNSFVIFDGYPEEKNNSNTKNCERLRRSGKNVGRDIVFDETTKITFSQQSFLSNEQNKNKLINMLCVELQKNNFITKVAEADADVLIVKTGISIATDDTIVKIVGQDIDLLVLLTQLAPPNSNVFFVKKSTGGASDETYNVSSFKYKELSEIIAFLHAFGGCDTTSSFYRQGKNKWIKLMVSNSELISYAKKFNEPNAQPSEIERCGNAIISAMYSAKKEFENLEDLRYLLFRKSSIKPSFKLESLPPTEAAGKQHAFRVYHQVQCWLGSSLNPTKWGWKYSANGLQPVLSETTMIPNDLIKQISCKCKTECKNACGCRKHGLRCSDLCINCHGESCSNIEVPAIIIDDDLEDECLENCDNAYTNSCNYDSE